MFTEAVDNFVDNWESAAWNRRVVPLRSELPNERAPKPQIKQYFKDEYRHRRRLNRGVIFTIIGNLWHDWTIIP
jgi:hypothetical protein